MRRPSLTRCQKLPRREVGAGRGSEVAAGGVAEEAMEEVYAKGQPGMQWDCADGNQTKRPVIAGNGVELFFQRLNLFDERVYFIGSQFASELGHVAFAVG